MIVRKVSAYGLGIGLGRGAAILSIVLADLIFPLAQVGEYSLYLVTSQLLFPFISLNLSSVIAREGFESRQVAVRALSTSVGTSVSVGLISLAFSFHFKGPEWLIFAGVFAISEAIHQAVLAFERSQDNIKEFILVSFFRMLVVLVPFGACSLFCEEGTLKYLLILQTVGGLLISFSYFVMKRFSFSLPSFSELYAFLKYSLPLVPYAGAQWVSSSSDRYFLNFYHGKNMVGAFSILYSLAMVLQLVNSGIGIVLPQEVFKKFSLWAKGEKLLSFYYRYALASLMVYLSLMTFLIFRSVLFGEEGCREWGGREFSLIYLGVFFLGSSLFFSAFLFYFRRTYTLSVLIFLSAVTNVILNFVFIPQMSMLGAALSTFVSYLLLFVSVQIIVARQVKALARVGWSFFKIIFLFSLVVAGANVLFSYLLEGFLCNCDGLF